MDQISAAVRHLLFHCGSLCNGEEVVIISDATTADFVDEVVRTAAEKTQNLRHFSIPQRKVHGQEPPQEVAQAMLEADLVLGFTKLSLAHSHARKNACENGARYLSLPDYSLALLQDPAVLADFKSVAPMVRAVAEAFSEGSFARVLSDVGTDVELDIRGRIGNACPGFVDTPGSLGSPPDIEANVSPVETFSTGIVVVDGSIPCPEVGLLKSPVRLEVERGRIVKFNGTDKQVLSKLEEMFTHVGSDKAYVLAECGVGLNEKARLSGSMLTDEGAMGCMHFGFGANASVGGLNDVPFHLDFVFREASLFVDDKPILEKGKVVL